MPLQAGDTLFNGQYRILHQLGRGGFGFVYQAEDTLLGEQVAIKELLSGLVGDETTLKRFLAEAKATIRLAHDHIVRTYNVFRQDGNYYIVMEYMAGGSLESRLQQQGRLSVDGAVRLAAEVCRGLGYAHERGVVHCDLKPANILFDADGAAKVADFGIAHVSEKMITRSWLTPSGFVAGTLPYMSPEQADGVRDDPRVDIYALGAVLYRALTGRTYLAFDERDTPGAQADNVYRIRHDQPAAPGSHRRNIPGWLDGVVLKTLAKRPEDRYASAGELRAALLGREAAAPLPPAEELETVPVPAQPTAAGPAAQPELTPVPVRAKLPSWFWPAAAGAVALLAIVVLALGLLGGNGEGGAGPATAVPTEAVAVVASATPQPQPTETLAPTPGATQPWTVTPSSATPPLATVGPSSTETVEPAPSDTPALPSSTPRPTATPQPAATPLASTATPAPTHTLVPRTATPAPPTRTPLPTPTPPNPTPYPAPSLLEPLPDADLQGKVRFTWQWNHAPLQGDHYFDLRIWSQQEQDLGLEPRGAVELTKQTAAEVDLAWAPAVQDYGPGPYYWTVVVVQGTQRPRVVGQWGERRRFRFSGAGEPGPGGKPTPLP